MTAGNLFCGFLGILFCFQGYWALGAFMVFIGVLLDWGDGFAARLLNAYSDTGEQLDSFADLITFGLLPSVIVFQLILQTQADWIYTWYLGPVPFFSLASFLIVIGAAFRLSWFNTATEKSSDFSGLPSPAAGLFFASLPLIIEFDIWGLTDWVLNPWLLILFAVVISWLMVSRIPFLGVKFKTFALEDNLLQYILIASAIILLYMLWFLAVPLILLIYFLLSIVSKYMHSYEVSSEN